MKYPLVEELKAEGVRVTTSCRVLGFSPQGFYKWRKDPCSNRDRADAELVNVILDIHEGDPEFGYRFIADELHRLGHCVSENRVHRLCKQHKIFSTTVKKGRHGKKPGPPVHDDLVERDFTAGAANERWVGDITEHWTGEGKLYLCTFKDLWSNRIVGYSIADRMTANLAVVALRNAHLRRDCAGVIVHTDRGSQAELNWSLQHPDLEGGWTLCMHMKDKRQSGRCGARCSLPAVHRSLGEETAWPSGTRSLRARRPMMPPRLRGCHHRSAIGGSGTLEE